MTFLLARVYHYLNEAWCLLLQKMVTVMLGYIFDYISENPIKSLAIAAATVATGGAAAVMAPAIGAVASAAGLGMAGGTLSGAAASSAGLAALGGGSLASGGLGMAGGKVVVTTVGALVGGSTSGSMSSLFYNT
ncbi:hypothetical protein [Erwinia sp. MYb416]|uniref:hypothetical protein n=1 Tax=Erwinia sp. MYb416 TaxID=3108532 RepID=UPI0030B61024